MVARERRSSSRSPPCDDYALDGEWLSFPSAVTTPHPENNTVRARYFPEPLAGRAAARGDRAAAVERRRRRARRPVPAAQPLQDQRAASQPPLSRRRACRPSSAAPTTSSAPTSAGRRRSAGRRCSTRGAAIAWLAAQGYESIGILGTSLGLVPVDADHRARAAAAGGGAQPHLAVLRRRRLGGPVDARTCARGSTATSTSTRLRRIWMPISPYPYLERMRGKRLLLVYARYDLTFPVDLSRMLVDEFRRRGIAHQLAVLPCGHYSTGVTPFKWLDGLTLCRFLIQEASDESAACRRSFGRTGRSPSTASSSADGGLRSAGGGACERNRPGRSSVQRSRDPEAFRGDRPDTVRCTLSRSYELCPHQPEPRWGSPEWWPWRWPAASSG